MPSRRLYRAAATVTSPAAPSSGTVSTAVFTGLGRLDAIAIHSTVTGATGGTLGVIFQWYDGVDWWDLARLPTVGVAAATATNTFKLYRWTRLDSPTMSSLGKNGTVAILANSVNPCTFGTALRVVFVAGAGTSAGASQSFSVSGLVVR